MKKRILSFFLMLVMVVTMVPFAAFVSSAEEAVVPTADDFIVKEGLIIWLDGTDAATIDLDAKSWANKGTSGAAANATITGDKYNASSAVWGWQLRKNGNVTVLGRSEEYGKTNTHSIGITLPISALPDSSYTAELVASTEGYINADGTAVRTEWKYYDNGGTKTPISSGAGNKYGFTTSETFAYGPVRTMTYVNRAHYNVQYTDATGTTKVGESEDSNELSSRWYYTGMLYSDHSYDPSSVKIDGKPAGLWVSTGDTTARDFEPREIYDLTITYALTGGNTYDTASSVTISGLYNGLSKFSKLVNKGDILDPAKHYGNTLLPPNAGYTKTADAADRQRFQFMMGMPGDIFQFRMYNRVLSTKELAQNHFADLVIYNGLDLTVLANATDKGINKLINSCANLPFSTPADTLQQMIDAVEQKGGDGAEKTVTYEQLFVQNGLKALFLAKDANVTTGLWADASSNGNNAQIFGSDWKSKGNAIYYAAATTAADNATKNKDFIVLPTAAFGNDFYTEISFKATFVSNNGTIVPHTGINGENPYGNYNGDGNRSAFSFGGLKMCYFMPSTKVNTPDSNTNGCNSQARVFFGVIDWVGGNPPAGYLGLDGTNYPYPFGKWSADPAENTLVMTPTSMKVTRVQGDNDATYTWVLPTATVTVKASSNTKVSTPFVLPEYSAWANPFEVFNGFPAEVYSIRVYDHELTPAEQKQNHFAELICYFEVDLKTIANAKATALKKAYDDFAAFNFDTDKQTIFDYVDAMELEPVVTYRHAPELSSLYVQNGLKSMFLAYNAYADTIDLAAGTWDDLSDNAYVANLIGGVYDAANKSWGWRRNADGGIFYRFNTVAICKSQKGNMAISFPGEALGDGNFFVESVFQPYFVSGDDGVFQFNTTSDGAWGVYGDTRSAFAFGGAQVCFFFPSANTSGASAYARLFNYNKPWGQGPQASGYAEAALFGKATPTVKDVIPENVTLATSPLTMHFTRTVSGAVVNYSISTDLGSATFNNQKSPYVGSWTMAELARPFEMFGGFPANVFAVRTYNHALTEAELAQNHFADICGYFDLDLTNYTYAKASAVAALKDEFAKVDFATGDKETLQGMIDSLEQMPNVVYVELPTPEDIYVKDGLQSLFLAFNGYEDTIDLANGTWNDLSDNAYVADLIGGAYNAANKSWGWRRNEDGGIFYRFNTVSISKSQKDNMAISFPGEALGDGNFYVESVFQPYFVSGDDGVFLYNTKSDGTYGVYGANRSAFAFGGAQFCFFFPSVNKGGASASVRLFNWNKPWGQGPQQNGFTGAYLFGKADPVEEGVIPENVTLATSPLTMRFTRTVSGAVVNYRVSTDLASASFNNQTSPYVGSWTMEQLQRPFEMFGGFPANVYAVRTYNRELTPAEQAQNHFADLVGVYQLTNDELLKFAKLDANIQGLVYDNCKNIKFVGERKDLLLAIDEATDLAEQIAAATKDYDKLYVQDGLVMLLDAFDGKTGAITGSTWYNLVNPAVNAQIQNGSKVSWTTGEGDKGIGYALTAAQHKAGEGFGTFINLGTGVVDCSKDYTVEYVAKGLPTTDNNGGYNTDRITEKFGPWGGWIFQSSGCRPIYNANGSGDNWGHKMNWGEAQDYNLFKEGKDEPATATFVINNPDTTVSTFKVLKNGKQLQAYSTNDGSSNKPSQAMYNASAMWIMQNVSNTTYAVRVYNRQLSAAEMARNHFIDICAYNGIDVTALFEVTDVQFERLINQFKDMPVAATSEQAGALQAAIDEAGFAAEVVEGVELTAYDELYVKDGLTLLLTAYDAEDASINLAKNVWVNKVEDAYNYAKFLGTDACAWKINENGGVYYRMSSVSIFDANKKNVGMILPAAALSDGDFTTELVFDPLGISGEDDVIVPHTAEGGQSKWGAYNGSRSAFAIAGMQMCFFHYSTASTGNSMGLRRFYCTNPWEGGANNNVKYEDSWNIFANEDKEWRDGIFTMTVDRVVADGAQFKSSTFNVQVLENNFTVANGQGTSGTKLDNAFYTLSTLGEKAYEAFFGFPANVLAIRAYNRVLTDAEKAQNHFADLAAYLKLDLEGFLTLDDDAKAAIYGAFATATFEMDADKAQNLIDAVVYAKDLMAGYNTTVEARNNDTLISIVFDIDTEMYEAVKAAGASVVATVKFGEKSKVSDLELAPTASLTVAIAADGLIADDLLEFTLQFELKLDENNSVFFNVKGYTEFGEDATVADLAEYYVNEFEGSKIEKYAYASNAALLSILGEEAEVRSIDLEPEYVEPIASAKEAYENVEEKNIDEAKSSMKITGADDSASAVVSKVRLAADSSASYTFSTEEDGKVRLVIEYVAKAYTLGYRGLSVQIDTYATQDVILSDGVTGVTTSTTQHGYYVMEFEVAAGVHTLTLGIGCDDAGNEMKSVELFSVAVQPINN